MRMTLGVGVTEKSGWTVYAKIIPLLNHFASITNRYFCARAFNVELSHL